MASVLYVDDEDSIRRAVHLWLSRRGHDVHTSPDARGARALMATGQFDAVFIDIRLGAESGLELFEWICGEHPRLAEHVAFVTGNPFDDTIGGMPAGRPVFAKPFELRALEEQAVGWAGAEWEHPRG